MTEQKLPNIFLHIGEFDMAFESTSPEDYVKHMQDQERLRSRYLDFKVLQVLSNTTASTPRTRFALERSFQGVGVLAVGTISETEHGEIHVKGKFGIGYSFLVIEVILFTLLLIASLRSDNPLENFEGYMIGFLVFSIASLLGLYSLKGSLMDYLKKTNTSALT